MMSKMIYYNIINLTIFFPLHVFVQIILALGNYMNSSKRGSVYGFKLQSLDLV